MATFFTVVGSDVNKKHEALRDVVQHPEASNSFEVDPRSFSAIPGSPFSYWATRSAIRCYDELPSLSAAGVDAMSTNQLSDDNRYARLWWEVTDSSLETWVPWAKGRGFSPYHYDVRTVVRWDPHRSTYTGFVGTSARPLEKPASVDWFFRPGLTWPRRSNTLSFSVLPRGSIFGNKGPCIFVDGDDEDRLLALCGVINSSAFKYLLSLQVARLELAQSFEVGLVQKVPLPTLGRALETRLSQIVRSLLLVCSERDWSSETSHFFVLPRTLLAKATSGDGVDAKSDLSALTLELEGIVFSAYGYTAEERAEVMTWAEKTASHADLQQDKNTTEDDDTEAVLAWAVGVVFGRFDRRLATSNETHTLQQSPFEPVPPNSPAMRTPDGSSGLSKPGILVDDPGHTDDLPEHVHSLLHDVGLADGPAASQDFVRSWLAHTYWPLHIKMYSGSRRRAPIWWQLSTPSLRYSIWISWREITNDTIYRALNDYIGPKLAHERRVLSSLREERDDRRTNEDAELEMQARFVEELETMAIETQRIAPIWSPHPDDGVIINFAPLWRLVPHNSDWQKELRETWKGLCSGNFDWSHLAMHLWPERVVPKCADDRSLAIAHDLASEFWIEDENGRWKSRNSPLRPIAALVAERASPAVKDALKSLLEAPELLVSNKRTRKSKAT